METGHQRAHEDWQGGVDTWNRDGRMASVLVHPGRGRGAQPLIDFVFWMHFIKPIYVIEPFALARGAILVIVTSGIGFVIGSVFAFVWNTFHKA